jgi:hypothetical protein
MAHTARHQSTCENACIHKYHSLEIMGVTAWNSHFRQRGRKGTVGQLGYQDCNQQEWS